MEHILEERKNKLERQIRDNINGIDNSKRQIDIIISQNQITALKLLTERTETSIGAEKINSQNAPSGFQYTPGKEYEYVIIKIPVSGDVQYVKDALGGMYMDKFFYYNDYAFFFKEFSSKNISGNEDEIKRIQQKAKSKFDAVKNQFDSFETTVKDYNTQLAEFGNQVLEDQIEKERVKRESEDRLNPFK